MIKIPKKDILEAFNETLKEFDQTKYITQFVKEHYRRYEIRCNVETDKDLIEHLDAKTNKNDYIKSLIRMDIK